jgi:serine/threonine protein kinase
MKRLPLKVPLIGNFNLFIHRMAPVNLFFYYKEVIKEEDCSKPCDIWSLGCTIIEMLTGLSPYPEFDKLSVYAVLYKIANENISPKIPENISFTLKLFLKRCFMRNPKERATLKELINHPFILNEIVEDFSSDNNNLTSPGTPFINQNFESINYYSSGDDNVEDLKNKNSKLIKNGIEIKTENINIESIKKNEEMKEDIKEDYDDEEEDLETYDSSEDISSEENSPMLPTDESVKEELSKLDKQIKSINPESMNKNLGSIKSTQNTILKKKNIIINGKQKQIPIMKINQNSVNKSNIDENINEKDILSYLQLQNKNNSRLEKSLKIACERNYDDEKLF